MCDWVGLRVRLLRNVETHGGDSFPCGTEMEVSYVGGRGFVLVADGGSEERMGKRWLRNIPASDLAIVSPVSPYVETRVITARCKHHVNPHVWQRTPLPSSCYHCGRELDEQTLAYLAPYDTRVKIPIQVPDYIEMRYPVRSTRMTKQKRTK
jgi:hypothetical protein